MSNKTQGVLEGTVFSGVGRGSKFVSLCGYMEQFRDSLGILPFAGTLNIHVDPIDAEKTLGKLKSLKIKGFVENDKKYGELSVFKVKVNDIEGYIVVPKKTHYKKDTLEIISEVNLRERLMLEDGDMVKINPSSS